QKFAIPVPCHRPIEVTLRTRTGATAATATCGSTDGPGSQAQCAVVTDASTPPFVEAPSVNNNDTDVDRLTPPSLMFNETVNVDTASCPVKDSKGNALPARCAIDPVDGRTVQIVPDIRLQYGKQYTVQVSGVRDLARNEMQQEFA